MQFKTRLMLAAACVAVLALNLPAESRPAAKQVSKQAAKSGMKPGVKQVSKQGTQHRGKIVVLHAKQHADDGPRLVSVAIAEPPKRPMLGWPALVREARKYMGTNPTRRSRLWCATFMNMVLAKVGYSGTNSDSAKSFAQYGHRISEPEIGAIAVLTRGNNGGHVGVVSGVDKDGNPIIISGNHGHRVGEAIYPRSRVIAYVMPSGSGSPVTTEVAARSQPVPQVPQIQQAHQAQASAPGRNPSGGIDSPITELLAAIEAERRRPERPRPQVAQARTPEPRPAAQRQPGSYRAGQQPQDAQKRDTDPRLNELLGLSRRLQEAPLPQQPRVAPIRQRQVQLQADRVVR